MNTLLLLEIALGVIPILVAQVVFQHRVISHLKYILSHAELLPHIKTRSDDIFDKVFKE